MKAQKHQYVTIKGTKNGLTLHLDDNCSFEELLYGLQDVLSLKHDMGGKNQKISVLVKLGYRYITKEQEAKLTEVITDKQNLFIHSIESEVMTKKEAIRLKKESEVISVAKIVRSGQVLETDGDLLLIGDVNPGGMVIAGGNIFILGSLRGIAHAGFNGNTRAVIAASDMRPTQLRINHVLNRSPDHIQEKNTMECAYLDENENMVIDRLQKLAHLRPGLTRLEGGM
ncbi:septum site-determining protein MinC [Bacillus sp. CLL-7-23]|uniref:Probable septum site-determining protein MinC n=1 Tax=Bacillus changyiensis TaxID=3004103 RepID=A0ABT4X5N4_9BACI|nr:septum site-determining protein MinC [Bacillus changyiensis]MDA1477444.1 septum site-determining protein MinC [Bacillus changyiensis]MDA7027605.1 septum site-determining protein MinC [Bacillus changyiensis]